MIITLFFLNSVLYARTPEGALLIVGLLIVIGIIKFMSNPKEWLNKPIFEDKDKDKTKIRNDIPESTSTKKK